MDSWWVDWFEDEVKPSKGLKSLKGCICYSLDLSLNQLTGTGLSRALSSSIFQEVPVLILKLHRNYIEDRGMAAIAELVKTSRSPTQEIHLSHNDVTEFGTCVLLAAVQSSSRYPYQLKGRDSPLWLRLEHNRINNDEVWKFAKEKDITHASGDNRDCWWTRKEGNHQECPLVAFHWSISNQRPPLRATRHDRDAPKGWPDAEGTSLRRELLGEEDDSGKGSKPSKASLAPWAKASSRPAEVAEVAAEPADFADAQPAEALQPSRIARPVEQVSSIAVPESSAQMAVGVDVCCPPPLSLQDEDSPSESRSAAKTLEEGQLQPASGDFDREISQSSEGQAGSEAGPHASLPSEQDGTLDKAPSPESSVDEASPGLHEGFSRPADDEWADRLDQERASQSRDEDWGSLFHGDPGSQALVDAWSHEDREKQVTSEGLRDAHENTQSSMEQRIAQAVAIENGGIMRRLDMVMEMQQRLAGTLKQVCDEQSRILVNQRRFESVLTDIQEQVNHWSQWGGSGNSQQRAQMHSQQPAQMHPQQPAQMHSQQMHAQQPAQMQRMPPQQSPPPQTVSYPQGQGAPAAAPGLQPQQGPFAVQPIEWRSEVPPHPPPGPPRLAFGCQ
eukprot:TRINITY_DN31528_c0_g1_i1.p1 TRINITY_DN31528_c0_g1~~TRINITY_DN31528_c0_g1_i1.p1  ORF type:complete len:685 (-),score=132.94 TRINITY_DN31528_c0_g1_i1:90-1937(-)